MFSVSECPVCNGRQFKPLFTCTDYTVSHETFQLVTCQSCELVITTPRPDDERLGTYYISNDYISHSGQARNITEKIYTAARHFTLRWKLSLIKKYATKTGSLRILDYGCGTGDFLHACQQAGHRIMGIEPSPQARQLAMDKTTAKITENINQLSDNQDIITMWHVLEHVPDLNQVLERLVQLLEINGTMFIALPNHKSKDAKKYGAKWAGYDVPRHLWHFSQHSMHKLMLKNNLHLIATVPMKLDAFYVSLLSEKYKGASSIMQMINGFITGIFSNWSARNNSEYSSLIYIVRKK